MIELTDIRFGTVMINVFTIASVRQIGNQTHVYLKAQPKLIVSESYEYIVNKADEIIQSWMRRKGGMA